MYETSMPVSTPQMRVYPTMPGNVISVPQDTVTLRDQMCAAVDRLDKAITALHQRLGDRGFMYPVPASKEDASVDKLAASEYEAHMLRMLRRLDQSANAIYGIYDSVTNP